MDKDNKIRYNKLKSVAVYKVLIWNFIYIPKGITEEFIKKIYKGMI